MGKYDMVGVVVTLVFTVVVICLPIAAFLGVVIHVLAKIGLW
jgi:hypothetical protein